MKKFALLGHNIDYSLSPIIHGHIYKVLGVDAKYDIVSCSVEELSTTIQNLKDNYDGFNVTKPHKTNVIKYLKTNNSSFDAVNTVVCREGTLTGENTDYYGFITHLLSETSVKGKNVLVLGAGGVANVVVASLVDNGAVVSVYNRTTEKAKALADKYGCKVALSDSDKADIIVNCTSLGLNAGENPCSKRGFTGVELVYDTIYFNTDLLQKASACGVKTLNGLDMLILQGIRADEIFFDVTIDSKSKLVEEIKKLIEKTK